MAGDCVQTFGDAVPELIKCLALIPVHSPDPLQCRCSCFFVYRRTMKDAGCEAKFSTHGTADGADAGGIEQYVELGPGVRERCLPYWGQWAAEHPRPTFLMRCADTVLAAFEEHQWLRWLAAAILVAACCLCACLALCKSRAGQEVLAELREACAADSEQCADGFQECPRPGKLQEGDEPDAEEHQGDSDSDAGQWPGLGGLFGSLSELFASSPGGEDPGRPPGRASREVAAAPGSEDTAPESPYLWQPPYIQVDSTNDEGHHVVHAHPEVLKRSAREQPPARTLPPRPHSAVVPFPHGRLRPHA